MQNEEDNTEVIQKCGWCLDGSWSKIEEG